MSSSYTVPVAQPLRSISLKPIEDQNPKHAFNCQCKICLFYQQNTVRKMLDDRQVLIKTKIQSRLHKKTDNTSANYYWILKHLLIPHNKIIIRPIDIFIPEIVFYKDGEPIELFLNRESQDGCLKKINKQKLTITFIQKLLNERRRKYTQLVKLRTGKKKAETKKNLFAKKEGKNVNARDAVVIRYRDGYEQLVSQNQFFALSNKRKQDGVWKKISFMRNFVTLPPNQPERSIMAKFHRQKIVYEKLFARSQTLMRVYGQNIIKTQKEYISDQQESDFCRQLLSQSPKILAEYLLYKIVSYIDYFYDEKITLLAAGFTLSEINHMFLTDVFKLSYQTGIKYDWTLKTIQRKAQEQEDRIFLSRNIEENPEYEHNSKMIEEKMMENYEGIKDHCGFSAVEEDNSQEVQNNMFFRKLHPEFKEEVTDILKNPTITLDDFKKHYLGYRKEKKPIIRDFNSTMIKTIHYMSPKFKRAQAHQYFKTPTRKLSPLTNPHKFTLTNQSKNETPISTLYQTMPVK